MAPGQIVLPVVVEDDHMAAEWACRTLGPAKEGKVTMAYIENTMRLETIYVSENMLPGLSGDIEVLSEPMELTFDENGKIAMPFDV
jgi:hypothetical protein